MTFWKINKIKEKKCPNGSSFFFFFGIIYIQLKNETIVHTCQSSFSFFYQRDFQQHSQQVIFFLTQNSFLTSKAWLHHSHISMNIEISLILWLCWNLTKRKEGAKNIRKLQYFSLTFELIQKFKFIFLVWDSHSDPESNFERILRILGSFWWWFWGKGRSYLNLSSSFVNTTVQFDFFQLFDISWCQIFI